MFEEAFRSPASFEEAFQSPVALLGGWQEVFRSPDSLFWEPLESPADSFVLGEDRIALKTQYDNEYLSEGQVVKMQDDTENLNEGQVVEMQDDTEHLNGGRVARIQDDPERLSEGGVVV